MSDAASYKLALLRASKLSIEIEVELTSRKSEALIVLLSDAKEAAAAALMQLVDADAEDPKTIRRLQNEVRRFDDLVGWMRQRLIEGPEAERELSDLQIQEARGLVLDNETSEQIGVQTEGNADD